MRFKIMGNDIPYTGKELRSGWVLDRTGIEGDAAAGFVGPCDVRNEDLVDLDDVRAGAFIKSESMAHVIAEHPGCGLETAVLRQRLLVCLLCEILKERGAHVTRNGDDVFYQDRKLTVSIAAPARRSALIHLGVNVRAEGAPVPAVGLEEMGLNAAEVLEELLERYVRELASVEHATRKVREVD